MISSLKKEETNGTTVGGRFKPVAKKAVRVRKPDYTLALMRLFFIIIVCAVSLALFADYSDYASFSIPAVSLLVSIFLAFSLKKAYEWERVVVLRLGKFHKVRGPGLFFLIPLFDHIYKTIDIRIRVLDFYSQETLTGDSVTVNVDAF